MGELIDIPFRKIKSAEQRQVIRDLLPDCDDINTLWNFFVQETNVPGNQVKELVGAYVLRENKVQRIKGCGDVAVVRRVEQ